MKILKIVSSSILAAISSVALSATLVPVQLINPVGSTNGQAIVSTGATTAPAWGNLAVTGISPVPANTLLGNATGSSASPTALAIPSCSASGGVLHWTSGSGFSCATGYALTASPLSQFAATTSAQLAGVISDESGTGSLIFGTSPSISQPAIAGVTNGSNAAAGNYGEFISNSVLTVPITNGTVTNVTSISLTAGDWDVSGVVQFTPAATTVMANQIASISTTSATAGPLGAVSSMGFTSVASEGSIVPTPTFRVSISATTTVYLIGQAGFSVSTCTVNGFIRARRVR